MNHLRWYINENETLSHTSSANTFHYSKLYGCLSDSYLCCYSNLTAGGRKKDFLAEWETRGKIYTLRLTFNKKENIYA